MANLPIAEFLTARLQEYDPDFELRPGTGFEKLFFQPLQFIVQPLRDEADEIKTAQSFRQILLTDDPDAFNEEAVDDLSSNIFVDRREGDVSSGVARAFYNSPVAREFSSETAVFIGNNSENYSNPSPFSISKSQMSAQISNGQYYFDIPVSSENTGEETELDADGLVSLLDDPDVASVTNLLKIEGGLSRETNTELIDRSKNSIAVRDLVTGKGFNATLLENFPGSIKELKPIGFGDDEMMRDILFNAHVGGKIDGHFCAPKISSGSSEFVGVLIDTTRQAKSTTNALLEGINYRSLGNPGVDRSNGLDPIVSEVKSKTAAEFISNIDFTNPQNLTGGERIKITIDGTTKDLRVAGVSVASTSKNEIIALINNTFGFDAAFPTVNSFKITSPTIGLGSEVIIDHPSVGTSAFALAFDDTNPAPNINNGDGPIVYLEGTHYDINDVEGEIRRVIGPVVVAPSLTGETSANNEFSDATLNKFTNVVENDILSITSGSDIGDYRILTVVDDNNLILDKSLTDTESNIEYEIRRTGIKDNEVVFVEYYFNPLSIDVGNLVKLDERGKIRGIRPGREDYTITDMAFLRIVSIEVIDPITKEATGEVLEGRGGFGLGGFGRGAYGVGSKADYRLIVNEPHERFSAFEDSYIVLNSGLAGLSLRVNYDYVPEIVSLHEFVRSENERILDGDILMKHFFPAFVEGTIEYSVDKTDTSILSNEDLQDKVRDFIGSVKSGQELQFSDIKQFIARETDPFDKYGTFIKNFTLKAQLLNTDGSITVLEGSESMFLPTLDPFPAETTRPQSAKISHWFAREGMILQRIDNE